MVLRNDVHSAGLAVAPFRRVETLRIVGNVRIARIIGPHEWSTESGKSLSPNNAPGDRLPQTPANV
jgi:hypothetical protein